MLAIMYVGVRLQNAIMNDGDYRMEGIMIGWAASEAYEKTGDLTLRGQLFTGYMKKIFKTTAKTPSFDDDVYMLNKDWNDVFSLL
ncbi:hypothetical protein AGMMS49953_01170 [Endomicrobiia bacterium]|nr:hypothetical protein AGMMS49953_01170 [Endomicrobiia bacterium]